MARDGFVITCPCEGIKARLASHGFEFIEAGKQPFSVTEEAVIVAGLPSFLQAIEFPELPFVVDNVTAEQEAFAARTVDAVRDAAFGVARRF